MFGSRKWRCFWSGGGKHSIILLKISNQVISVFCWLSATLECSPISERKTSGGVSKSFLYIFMYRLGSSPMWLSTLTSTYSGPSTSNVSFPRTEDGLLTNTNAAKEPFVSSLSCAWWRSVWLDHWWMQFGVGVPKCLVPCELWRFGWRVKGREHCSCCCWLEALWGLFKGDVRRCPKCKDFLELQLR